MHLACAAGDLDCVRALTERITATEEATAVSCTGVLVPSKTAAKAASEEQKINRTHLVQYADVELRNYDGEWIDGPNDQTTKDDDDDSCG